MRPLARVETERQRQSVKPPLHRGASGPPDDGGGGPPGGGGGPSGEEPRGLVGRHDSGAAREEGVEHRRRLRAPLRVPPVPMAAMPPRLRVAACPSLPPASHPGEHAPPAVLGEWRQRMAALAETLGGSQGDGCGGAWRPADVGAYLERVTAWLLAAEAGARADPAVAGPAHEVAAHLAAVVPAAVAVQHSPLPSSGEIAASPPQFTAVAKEMYGSKD